MYLSAQMTAALLVLANLFFATMLIADGMLRRIETEERQNALPSIFGKRSHQPIPEDISPRASGAAGKSKAAKGTNKGSIQLSMRRLSRVCSDCAIKAAWIHMIFRTGAQQSCSHKDPESGPTDVANSGQHAAQKPCLSRILVASNSQSRSAYSSYSSRYGISPSHAVQAPH